MSSKDRHVVPHDDGWAVKPPNANRPSSLHHTQREAIKRAQEIAERTHGEVVIHGTDGRIRDEDSYGDDPVPPCDQKH